MMSLDNCEGIMVNDRTTLNDVIVTERTLMMTSFYRGCIYYSGSGSFLSFYILFKWNDTYEKGIIRVSHVEIET